MNRRTGAFFEATHLKPGDHICWTYGSDEEHRRVLTSFLAAGLQAGQRVAHFAPRGREVLLLDYLREGGADPDRLIADGRLVIGPAEESYAPGGAFDPDESLRGFRAMVNQTLADGFTGLRVAGENGWILSDPRYRDAWIPYEVRVDRMISGLPLVGMCSFDIRECDDDAMQVMDAVHPVRVGAGSTTSSFHLHSHRDGRIAVQGELDYTMSDTVRSLLAALAEDGAAPEVDLAELTFSDVRGISAIASGVREFAATGSPVRLQGAPSTFRRIWGLLELDRVAPVEFVASRAAVG